MALEDVMCCFNRIWAGHVARGDLLHKEIVHIHQVNIGSGKVVRNEGVTKWREATDGCTMNKIMDEIRE